MPRLTDEDRAELRAEWARGGSPAELAVAYGITERHVRRLCANVERHLPLVEGSVTSAVEQFLDGLELDGRTDSVIAETARLVAVRLDRPMRVRRRRWRNGWSACASSLR
jgi:hypothetical protein